MAIKNIFKKKQWKADFEAGRDAYNAGQYKAAETHLRSALAKSLEIDEGDSSYGDTCLVLGQTVRRLEKFEESLELTGKAFHHYLTLFGATDSRTVQAHLSMVLADPTQANSNPDLAKATHRLALKDNDIKSWQAVRTAALALAHFDSSEREKALGQVQEACAHSLGEGRGDLGAWPPVAEEFALELSRLGYLDLASRFMGSQLRMYEERYGDRSEEAALTRLTLGEFFLAAGEPRKADTALKKALEQLKLKHGPRSDFAQRATIGLGQALARQGKLVEAAPYLTESLENLGDDQKQERLEALTFLLEYKCMVLATDSERGALWRELEGAWEANPTDLSRTKIYKGLLAAQRRLQEAWELTSADRFLEAVLKRVRGWRGPHHPDVAATMMELARCACLREDDAKAKNFIEQSLALDEGVDNLIRAVGRYAELGEQSRAAEKAKMAHRLVRSSPRGLEQGRRQAAFAESLLAAGDLEGALEQSEAAIEQLPDAEQNAVRLVEAAARVMGGQFEAAEKVLKAVTPRLTEPVGRAKGFLYLAWIQCTTGRFPDMQESLAEVKQLSSLRADHPLLMEGRALLSQGAYYSGNVYQGKEERDFVFEFLRKGRHQQSRRALPLLTLLEPFGPDEFQTELDVGTQILAASRYPEGVSAVFPLKDVACTGLRHLTRALFFHGQEALAQERLTQLKERFEKSYDKKSPLYSSVSLCEAALAQDFKAKTKALEVAQRDLRALSPRHVNLFPTLTLLAEQYLEHGIKDKARRVILEALKIRKGRRLKDWLAALEKGQLPEEFVKQEVAEPDQAVDPVMAADMTHDSKGAPPTEVSDSAAGEDGSPSESTELGSSENQDSSRPPLFSESQEYIEPPYTEEEASPREPVVSEEVLADESTVSLELEAIKPETVEPEPAGLETADLDDSGTLVAYVGAMDVAGIPMADELRDRDEPPSVNEVEEFLEETEARFGDDPVARQEAYMLLALCFPDGNPEGTRLWEEALQSVQVDDLEKLSLFELRAQERGRNALVVTTLQRRLSDEIVRYGDQAAESIDTLTKMAQAYESQGLLDESYRRIILTTEILRSWYGARSRRLLDPLSTLIRLSEKREDVPTALDHHLERHRLLESGQSKPEELFSSRIALMPIRGILGQIPELMDEATTSEAELPFLGPVARSQFATVLLTTALRVERLHWRVEEAAKLLEMGLEVLPESEVSLRCRLQIAYSECQVRRDYRSQARRLRDEILLKATSLESDARAEICHEAAESCLRVRELPAAREIAEKLLEERIAVGGRKDRWAGRALLLLAEADLRSYRLEGTETEIAMSRPSLEGSLHWVKAQQLRCQAVFFLGREEEAFGLIEELSAEDALFLELALAVWSGRSEYFCEQIASPQPSVLGDRWRNLEKIPLDQSLDILNFLARVGRVRLLDEGLRRLQPRLVSILPTDIRIAGVELLRATMLLWEGQWSEAETLLQRVLDILPSDRVELPDGLSSLVVRAMLVNSLLAQKKLKQAEAQANAGVSEAADFLGEEDIRALAFRSHVALCAEARGRHEDALVALDEILTPLQERLGETHPLLRELYRGLSKAFFEQDEIESARLTAEEALRIDQECRGLSIHLLQDLHLLAKIERTVEKSEAGTLLETACELGQEILGADHPFMIRLAQDRAEVEAEQEAEPAIPETSEERFEVEPSLDGWEVVADDADEDEELDSAESLFDFGEDADTVVAEEESVEEEAADEEESIEESEAEVEPVEIAEVDEEEAVAEEESIEDEPADEEESVEESEAEAEPVEVAEVDEEEAADEEESIEDEPAVEEESVEESEVEAEPVEVAEVDEEEVVDEEEAADEEESVEESEAEAEPVEVAEVDEEEAADEEESIEDEPAVEEESVEESEVEAEPVEVAEADEEEAVEEAELEAEAPSLSEEIEKAAALVRTRRVSVYQLGPQSASASVELGPEFPPPLPYRMPIIDDLEDDLEDFEEAEPSDEDSVAEPEAAEDISVERMAEILDPEAFLPPLAPVFFLPVPWKEATEAPFEKEYETLYHRFQEQFGSDGEWRSVVEASVSMVRKNPTSNAGYFLFLVGAQLEKGGRLHTADLCLATAIELLESGPAFGAACHMAGRVAGRRGELRRALDYFERAAELAEEQELAVLKVDAAECHLGLGRPEEALIGFEEVYEYLAENVPKVQSMAVQAKMAQIHLLIGDPDTSQALAEETLANLSPKNSGTYRVLGRILLSRAFARLGRHELALELAEKAWSGAKRWSAKRREGRRIAISNLVDIYSVMGRFDKAEEMIHESGLLGWGLAESELLLRAGHVACAQGRLEDARSYLRLGKSFLTRFRSPALWRSSFMELEAELALQQGDVAKADQFSRRALELFEQEATGPVDRSRHLVRAGRIAGAMGDVQRARQLIEEAHSLRDLHLGAHHPHTESVEGMTAAFGLELG